MKKLWVIGDTHFNHTNIIKYTNRPFRSVEEMNETIINNWNRVVGDEDLVIHLGDFGFFWKEEQAKEFADRLSGRKILILGNHDRKKWDWKAIGFEGVTKKLVFQDFIFSHKPLQPKDNPQLKQNIHGHIHDKNSEFFWQSNVCVEKINYTPLEVFWRGGIY